MLQVARPMWPVSVVRTEWWRAVPRVRSHVRRVQAGMRSMGAGMRSVRSGVRRMRARV